MSKLNLVETTVSIASQKIHVVSLKLFQSFNSHHRCEILVDFEELDKAWMHDPVKIIKYIGEPVIIEMKHIDSGETNIFRGIISNLKMIGRHGQQNHIQINAASETFKLEGKPSMDSFVNKTLEEVVNEVVKTSGNGAGVTINPKFKHSIEYLCKHEESAFQFFNRLSYLYGEFFFSNGITTYFGQPDLGETIPIKYDVEITSLDISANLLPPNFQRYDYLVDDDEERIKRTRQDVPEATGYLKAALDKSESFYTSDAILPLHTNVSDTDSILKMVDIERTRTIADMLTLSGTSQTCKIGIGKVINVVFPDSMKVTTSAGDFIITEVTHEISQEGHYSNSFSGVRAALDYIPTPQITMPVASSQRAIVVSNADPYNCGRVKVCFQWQRELNKTTNWIRVQTNNGGGTGVVSKNRGFVFIPEIGDEVMINFESNDPSKPYCGGSMFPITKSEGGKAENAVKSIMTRSGIKIVFNDYQKSLHIEDPSGNKWSLDGEGNIRVYAPKKIHLSSNDINIDVRNDLILNVGRSWISNIVTGMTTTTPYLKQVISGQMRLYSGEMLIYSDSTIDLESKRVTAIGKDSLFLHSDKSATVNSKGTAFMHGARKTSYTNNPEEPKDSSKPVITDVIIEFRPHNYDEKFGFDWLRVDDSNVACEPVYESLIEGVYNSKKDEPTYQGEDAKKHLKDFYEQYKIQSETDPYFVPYLNLYPNTSTGYLTPPSKVNLKILKKIKIPLQKLEIEFESEFFKIGGKKSPFALSDIAINPDKTKKEESSDTSIEIECIKEFGTEKFINVYAYPEIVKDAPEPERQFAGKIYVCPNAKQFRKVQKVVFIPLTIKDKNGVTKSGKVHAFDKDLLTKVFYQTLMYADTVEIEAFDVSDAKYFESKITGTYNFWGKIDTKSEFEDKNIFVYTKDLFFSDKKNAKYKDYILIFVSPFDSTSYRNSGETHGGLDDVKKSIWVDKCLFIFPCRDASEGEKRTTPHEALHALGLLHTFHEGHQYVDNERVEVDNPDGTKRTIYRIPDNSPKKCYYKTDKATDNIMSYKNDVITMCTWKWQWDILHGR